MIRGIEGRFVGAVESREAPRRFCAKVGFWNGGGKSGNRIRNAAPGGTSETWDREVNTFGRWDKILLPRTPTCILALLCQTILKKTKSLLKYGAIS
jgi:hypothetical protein